MALSFRKEIDQFTSLAIWKIEETAEELTLQLQLKEHEKSFLDSLINGKRNLHWLSTRVLLRTMLNTPQYIDCKIDAHGKPYLANFPHHISLSHSHNYAAVMVSENKPVGIDIEFIQDKIEHVQHRFMSVSELDFINKDHQTDHLYICWCAKEAIYKLHGKKNISFLNHIKISPFNYQTEGILNGSLVSENQFENYLVHYQKFDSYMLGYAIGNNDEK
ncbi:MAG: 4'-phosphopantetheinyl transferase superfamily protein [Daejeonella sp.]